MEAILEEREIAGARFVLVRWTGAPAWTNSWEPLHAMMEEPSYKDLLRKRPPALEEEQVEKPLAEYWSQTSPQKIRKGGSSAKKVGGSTSKEIEEPQLDEESTSVNDCRGANSELREGCESPFEADGVYGCDMIRMNGSKPLSAHIELDMVACYKHISRHCSGLREPLREPFALKLQKSASKFTPESTKGKLD